MHALSDGQLSNERQIYDKILTGYSSEVRPLINSTQAVRVELSFELTKINQIVSIWFYDATL